MDLTGFTEKIGRIRTAMSSVLVGQERTVDLLLTVMLAKGHVLIEGVPGIAKTLMARLMAQLVDARFSRIQFTPDLMPSDVLGTSVFNMKTSDFDFHKGPIFADIVLVDEVNRAPAKTQSALFEVMEERQVTLDGTTYKMSPLYTILATQNPVEQEGTYKLPEAQLDRFLMKITMQYPTLDEEVRILERHHANARLTSLETIRPVLTADELLRLSDCVGKVYVEPSLLRYVAAIVHQTRTSKAVYLGASPRASVAGTRLYHTRRCEIHRPIRIAASVDVDGRSRDGRTYAVESHTPSDRKSRSTEIMYLSKRFYIFCVAAVVLFLAGYVFPVLFMAGKMLLVAQALLSAADIALLWRQKDGVYAERSCAARFSNGDPNPVRIAVENRYPFAVHIEVIDELPDVFQRRDILFPLHLLSGARKEIVYQLRPVKRGEYGFGHIRLFVSTAIGFVVRRITAGQPARVKVYPSYLMLHRYELMAIHNNLTELGIKRIRRIGHHTEFEHIKEYVKGDDYRTINWKASARRHQVMVNTYQDERSQHIYNIIDKGRVMQSAFRGMTLLDYSINAALVLSFVAIRKEDKAGLITFAERFETFVPAGKQSSQMQLLLEDLYRQQTTFGESDYSSLYVHLNKHVSKRSLLIIYTNFDRIIGMERQLSYMQQLARQHVVLVIFFEDVELRDFAARPPQSSEDCFHQVIADRFIYEKQYVTTTLRRHGIYSLLTTPEDLSVDVINKYLEMKAKRLL